MAVKNSNGKSLNERVQIHVKGGKEYWRDIPGYEGLYRVSDWGRVKRLGKLIKQKTRWGGVMTSRLKSKMLKGSKNEAGYITVELLGGKRFGIHQLVLLTFVGPRPDEMFTRHLDGNPSNNYLNNLEWGTVTENNRDKIRHGTSGKGREGKRGEDSPVSKLTAKQVRRIRFLYSTGKYTLQQLADMHKAANSTIYCIVARKSWRYV